MIKILLLNYMYNINLKLVDIFLISSNTYKIKTDIRNIINPRFLLGIAFNTVYKDKK